MKIFFALGITVIISTSNLVLGDVPKWKFRAREHLEQINLNDNSQNLKYLGLTNTLNFWLEDPFKLSYGIAINPIIGTLKSNERSTNLTKLIRYYHAGGEVKYYGSAIDLSNIFIRGGLYSSHLDPGASLATISGFSTLVSVGSEWLVGGLGLAIEAGLRLGRHERSIQSKGLSIALGVHGYDIF